jgi:hypothetical protein
MEDQKFPLKKVMYPIELHLEVDYYGFVSISNATPITTTKENSSSVNVTILWFVFDKESKFI